MKNGWIKLHRSLLGWEWYDDINVKILFLHCVLKANHSDKNWRGVTIERGQFYTSLDTLSKELGLSVQKIRTAIGKLESTGEITSKQHARARIVTVINYDQHQADNKEITRNQQGSNKEVTTTKNNKNNKNKKNKTLADAETHDISWSSAGGWQNISADDLKQWQTAYPNANVAQQIEAMNQWLISNPSKAKKKLWRKFITNWLSRQQTTASRPQQKSFAEINAEAKKEIYRKNMKNMLW